MKSDHYVIDARSVSIQFGGVKAITDVNFKLGAGELRCLIGPNGAGKTTFFRLLTGVHRPSVGEIKINGFAIAGLNTHEIARLGVGIKTQIPSLFESLSVRENIWLAARRKSTTSEARHTVDETLSLVGLEQVADKNVNMLSHGVRQTVELGVVVAGKPQLILLDEPAAGMTGDEVRRTAEIIQRLNQHCALVVVEHDMQFIRMIAKTVTVFNRGSVLMEDTVENVLADERVRDVYLGKQPATVAA